MRNRFPLWECIALVVCWLLSGCGGGGGGTDDGTTRANIGPAGGTLQTADGKAKVVVPAGAVAATTTFTAKPLAAPPADPDLVPGTAWDLSAGGAALASAVQITIKYDPARIPAGFTEADLQMVTVDADAWVAAPGSTVDAAADTVTASVTHLSGWGIKAKKQQGNWIYFRAGDPLYRVHPDGTGFELAPKPQQGGLRAISPDRSRMISQMATGEIYECAADGTVIRQMPLSNMGQFFAYSPNGQKLLCNPNPVSTGGNLAVCSADGTNLTVVVPEDLNGTPGGSGMWMNNGRILNRYIESPNHNGRYAPGWTMWRTHNADGSGATIIIPYPDGEFVRVHDVSSAGQLVGGWDEEVGGNYLHWLARIDPGSPPSFAKIRLNTSGRARWSPAGDEIAYCYQGKLYRSPAAEGATPTLVYAPPGDNASDVLYWLP